MVSALEVSEPDVSDLELEDVRAFRVRKWASGVDGRVDRGCLGEPGSARLQ